MGQRRWLRRHYRIRKTKSPWRIGRGWKLVLKEKLASCRAWQRASFAVCDSQILDAERQVQDRDLDRAQRRWQKGQDLPF